jgi:hypothetical protein
MTSAFGTPKPKECSKLPRPGLSKEEVEAIVEKDDTPVLQETIDAQKGRIEELEAELAEARAEVERPNGELSRS